MGHEERLDANYRFPSGMQEYLDTYGWHFSKKMCEWAVSKMKRKIAQTGKEEPIDFMDKDKMDELLKKFNVTLQNDNGYNATYAINMARSDYFKSSIADEQHLAMFVRDYIDDPDGYPTIAFTRFYADCIGKGVVIPWLDVI